MFLQIIHILTMLAFTAHAVVGCCLHHEHQDESHCSTSQRSATLTGDSCKPACHHHHTHHEQDSRPEDSEPDPCHEGSCVFFADSVASKFDVKLTVSPSLAMPAFVTEMPALVSKTRSLINAPRDPRPPANLRLRAILHSWIV